MANGRLAKDVQYLCRHVETMFDGQVQITEVDDNLRFVLIDILPNGGIYKGAKLRFQVRFPDSYPEEVPYVICLDNVYHPNIDPTENGEFNCEDENNFSSNICVSLLDEWTESMGLDHIALAILFLMYNPNFDDALSPYFEGCEEEAVCEANTRLTLRGGSLDGVTFPRLLIQDEADDDVEEETTTAVKSDLNDGVKNAEDGPKVLVHAGAGGGDDETIGTSVDACCSVSSFGAVEKVEAAGDEPSKAENNMWTMHQTMLRNFFNALPFSKRQPVIDSADHDHNANNAGFSDVDSPVSSVAIRFEGMTFKDIHARKGGMVFSDFLRQAVDRQMDGASCVSANGEGDVD